MGKSECGGKTMGRSKVPESLAVLFVKCMHGEKRRENATAVSAPQALLVCNIRRWLQGDGAY